MKKLFSNIPTNIITGFLGAGKTSAILHLMSQKPANEKWSVLVNEFGSIGIDGAIYKAEGIDVKEIPGGCMCCVAGVPLQVAVNQLLKETQPDRLLIEPSGIGHPKKVLDTLRGKYFQEVLNIKASICLIDPRHLQDKRYTSHENFIDQIALSDILVANKADLCDSQTLQGFTDFSNKLKPAKSLILNTQQGELDVSLLDFISNTQLKAHFPKHHEHSDIHTTKDDGYRSVGLVFDNTIIFDVDKLTSLFIDLGAERIKAVIHTTQGWKIINQQKDQASITSCASASDSRVEIIQQVTTINEILDNVAFSNLMMQCVSHVS